MDEAKPNGTLEVGFHRKKGAMWWGGVTGDIMKGMRGGRGREIKGNENEGRMIFMIASLGKKKKKQK